MKTSLKILSLLSFILLSTYSLIHSQASNNSFSLNDYVLTDSTTIAEISDDLSGVTYNPLTNTLFMITNGNSRIYETDLEGQIIRSADLLYYSYGGNRRHDPEDIVHISGNRYAIAEERLGRIVYIRIDELGHDINLRDSTYAQLPGIWNSSDGIEGVSYDPNTDEMYCVVENSSKLLSFDESELNPASTTQCIFNNLADVSAVHHLGLTVNFSGMDTDNHILILSHLNGLLIEADDNCNEYSQLSVLGNQVEGVTMDNNGNIYVVGEPNEFYVYSNPNSNLNLCRYNDSLALVDFYNALDPTSSNFWDLNEPITAWAGVTLNESGCVTVLDLHERAIKGTISPSLSNLDQLVTLDLSENLFSGTIPPELGELNNLNSLILGSNQLTGNIPAELANLNNLSYLDLGFNQLAGCYPSQLNTLCSQLSYNNVSGGNNFDVTWENFCTNGNCTIVSCRQRDSLTLVDFYNTLDPASSNFWDLTKPINRWYGVTLNENGCVTEIYLEEAGLQGNIDPKLSNLSELIHLDLNGNELSGSIPSELGNLSNLNYLRLNSNQLTGNIPAELGNLSNLNYLILNSNQLTGNIPTELTNLNNLLYLRLSSNQLTGNIPAELGNLNNLSYLNLIANQLTGNIPAELGNLNNLSYLNLGYNQLTGCYPSTLNSFCGQLSYNNISGGNNLDADWENFCNNGSGICGAVWPGDFNYDGLANTMDVLIWGLAKDNDSPVRPNATMTWTAQDCAEAPQTVNGINNKHQDGDGNGIIDEQDLDVLRINYDEIHPGGFSNNIGFGSMDYEIELLSETTTGGSTTLTYGLSITDDGSPVNLHGLEYAVSVSGLNNYSIQIDATDSPLEPQQTFTRGTNTLNVALTRTDRSNRLCDDIVTKIVVVTQDVPEFQTPLEPQITIHDGHAIQADGTIYAVSASTTQTQAKEDESEQGGYLLQNHPNPFTDNTTIQYHISENVSNAAIQILDLTGRVVYAHSIDQTGEGEIQINTTTLPSGIYNYLLITNKGVSHAKKMIILR